MIEVICGWMILEELMSEIGILMILLLLVIFELIIEFELFIIFIDFWL